MRRSPLAAVLLLLGTACAISPQREIDLGSRYAGQLNRELPLASDPAIRQALRQSVAPILAVAVRQDLPWSFQVVNADVVNAFAVPGGHLYFTRGLIERAGDYAEFAGVVGHEIAHVDLRHSVEQMRKAQIANVGVTAGSLVLGRPPTAAEAAALNVAGAAVFAKFSRDDEHEADAWAVRYLTAAGVNPRGLIGMFRTLREVSRREPSAIEAFFSSHPMTDDRLAHVEQLIARNPAATRATQTGVTRFDAFDRLQALVRALPPPPQGNR